MPELLARLGVVTVAVFGLGLACAPEPGEGQAGAQADPALAFVGARIVDGLGGEPIEDGVLLVREGRIVAVGAAAEVDVPRGSTVVDVAGKTIVPGLVNAHGHVGATRGLSQAAENYSRENLLRQLTLYARYGVTTVFSLGGDGPEGVALRDEQENSSLDRARLYVAGPVVAADTPEGARQQVRAIGELGADLVKIRVDDFLGRAQKMPPEVYEAVIDEAHSLGLKVAVHLYYLEDAKAVLRAGADFIAHSVRDVEIDDELVELLLENEVCLCPTLTREVSTFVYETTPEFFDDPFFLSEADPADLQQLSDPDRQQRVRDNPSTEIYKQALVTAQRNLRLLSEAGVAIAFGTDSGPPARFQGYFEHLEMDLMAEAGLDPMQILVAATSDAARCMGREDEIGSIAPGRRADVVVLDENPLDDIRNMRSIHSVWIAGRMIVRSRRAGPRSRSAP